MVIPYTLTFFNRSWSWLHGSIGVIVRVPVNRQVWLQYKATKGPFDLALGAAFAS